MAGTAITITKQGPSFDDMVAEYVKVVTDLELLRAAVGGIADKLDADAAITLTNYASGAAVTTASTMTAASITLVAG